MQSPWIIVVLLVQYAALAVAFSLNRKTWPIALYYLGCVVKDAGVLILSQWSK